MPSSVNGDEDQGIDTATAGRTDNETEAEGVMEVNAVEQALFDTPYNKTS